jgi:hypothetical protein
LIPTARQKDHSAKGPPDLKLVASTANPPDDGDGLAFWTGHPTENVLVRLDVFRDGEAKAPPNVSRWAGKFSGRPGLIRELAAALEEQMIGCGKATVQAKLAHLRLWWRALDGFERDAFNVGHPFEKVDSVASLGHLHRQWALDVNLNPRAFGTFVGAANLARRALKLPDLHWAFPSRADSGRHLPEEARIVKLKQVVRRHWFNAVDRWNAADALLASGSPANEAEETLLANCRHFAAVRTRTGLGNPSAGALCGAGLSARNINKLGLFTDVMRNAFYPNAWDIRAAFTQCLAVTGWNPSTLAGIDVGEQFLVDHPKDSSRYVLRGFKERSASEQTFAGLKKTQGGPFFIIQSIVGRTEPLRSQLRAEVERLKAEYQESGAAPAGEAQAAREHHRRRISLFNEIQRLEQGTRSVWLYAHSTGIAWLDKFSYATMGRKRKIGATRTFLGELIHRFNATVPAADQLDPDFVPSDFRDAHALSVWRRSGGSVLHVMQALGHRSPRSTSMYIDNTIINEASQRLYACFSNALWHTIKIHKRLDPAIVAKLSRDGEASNEQIDRLDRYRELRRSRLGIGCKSPHQPPDTVAPGFVADGVRVCPTQRCTLCLEHAVIFPESIDGLCMRMEELACIQAALSIEVWVESTFLEELDNTSLALQAYDVGEVSALRRKWQDVLASGTHWFPEAGIVTREERHG